MALITLPWELLLYQEGVTPRALTPVGPFPEGLYPGLLSLLDIRMVKSDPCSPGRLVCNEMSLINYRAPWQD